MPKDTKNLGYIKALACESRGFVIKKEGVPIFDTPSCFYIGKSCEYVTIIFEDIESFFLI